MRRRSVEVIREGQAPTGAYLAAPTFPPYRYSWFRDGAFVADAMSAEGETASAEAFFAWCADTVLRHVDEPYLHARYDETGAPAAEPWSNDQVDGIGLWLWALRRHLDRHGGDAAALEDGVEASLAYLRRRRHEPSIDWWEERWGLHLATLACVRAGLEAWDDPTPVDLDLADERLDASELALAHLGFAARERVERVRARLVNGDGGVHRNLDDEYYGGGEWLLLKGFEGLALLRLGAEAEAREALRWIAARAAADGSLPEQARGGRLLRPERYEPWVQTWGPPACPLLWSHAMFLALGGELGWERVS